MFERLINITLYDLSYRQCADKLLVNVTYKCEIPFRIRLRLKLNKILCVSNKCKDFMILIFFYSNQKSSLTYFNN